MADVPAERECRLRQVDLARVTDLAQAGARESEIARQLGITASTLSRWKQQDPRLAEAIQRGRDALELQLIERVRNPELPRGKLSISERIALMRARQYGAVVLGNAIFAWRSEQPQEGSKVAVQIVLPQPATNAKEFEQRVALRIGGNTMEAE